MNHFHWICTIPLAFALGACSPQSPADNNATPKTLALTQGHAATTPYFTKDNRGNPVLCWAEAIDTNGTYRLAFAKYDAVAGDFSTPVTVPGSEGINTSPESMGKIAFKDDGTIVAVFAKPFPQEKNPFAGAIYYSISSDGGTSWSHPEYLHADTAHHYGRNFFDMARLGNGEVGAVWLDGRDKSIEGSTLYFTSTTPDRGFTGEQVLHRGTCECCRTDLLVDADGTLHVAYRSLMHPAALFGGEARDMAYLQSTDNGKTFRKEIPISADNWAIQACPHTGPTLAAEHGNLHAIWFTGGGTPGLYYAHRARPDAIFSTRILVTKTGSHPQSQAVGADSVLVVYDEPVSPVTPSNPSDHPGMHHSGGSHPNAIESRIRTQLIIGGVPRPPATASSGRAYHHHPVVTRVNDRPLIAWVREEKGKSTIVFEAFNQL